ncbi:MAG TPA: MlaD family protein [Solirubrobacteraceae bacterium]|nr:MlaD family protein [Solirubrobacteraceae bacterium]
MIAALVIVAVVLVTWYAFDRNLPFSHRFTAYAVVSNSVNVRGGDPVRIAGIDVGQVRGVTPDGDGSRIAFSLDRSALPIHRDATIRIRDRLFLEGSYYLELDPGTPAAPVLRDGSTIPRSQTSSPVQFFQLVSTFTGPVRNDLSGLVEALDQGLGPAGAKASSGAGAFKQAAIQLAPLFSDSAVVARALEGTSPGDVGRLLDSSAAVTDTLAQNSAQLAGLVRGLGETSSALSASDGALAQSVAGIDETLRAAPPALSAVDRSLPAVVALARALTPSLRVSPPILDRLTSTASQLAAVLAPEERSGLIQSLRTTFQRLPSILTRFASAFPVGKQITDCLQTHLLPILNATVPDGSLSTGQPVWQEFVHFLPGVAGATGSFDADGPYTRVLLGAGTNSLSGSFAGQQLVSTPPPGGSSLQGARPQWAGDLTAADFRPDAACATQPLPSLASGTSAPDVSPTP